MTEVPLLQRIALELQRQIDKDLPLEYPLRQIFWECTLRCNMNCRHCGSDCRTTSDVMDMPFEDFRRVLEDIRNHYDPHKIMVILTGGEPLLRKDICRCGRAIYEMEFPWGLVSNGRLMNQDMIDRLLASGIHSITISLDGFEKEHNWMRGSSDSFKYASEAVSRLAREDSVIFDVVTCVNNRNYGSLDEFKEYLISSGVKRWRLFTVFPVGRASGDKELLLDSTQFRGLMDFIVRTRKEKRISASYGCEGFLGAYEGKVRDRFFSCQAGISVASVLADGSISACPSIRAGYGQGNIYEDCFTDIWENGYGKFRDRLWMKNGVCAECRYFRYCKGNGMHLRDDEGKLILCHLKKLYPDA